MGVRSDTFGLLGFVRFVGRLFVFVQADFSADALDEPRLARRVHRLDAIGVFIEKRRRFSFVWGIGLCLFGAARRV